MPSIAVAVVIATRDRPRLLQATLAATAPCLRQGDEFIVVDSASRDPEVGDIARQAGAKVVRCDQPGACRARNAGFRASSSPVVAFTDDDCLPQAGWIEAVAQAFETHPHLAFLTGRVVPGNTDQGQRRRGVPLSTVTATVARDLSANDDLDDLGHGGNMAWSRQALDRLGGFDEVMGPGAPLRAAEDHDAFLRAISMGMEGRFEPAAVVVHTQWRGLWRQMGAYYNYGIGSGALLVKRALMSSDSSSGVGRSLWRYGVRPVGRALSDGYETAAVAESVKLVGMVQGVARGRRARSTGRWASPEDGQGGDEEHGHETRRSHP